jgi:alkylated DNA nucleotide flippase Atl1
MKQEIYTLVQEIPKGKVTSYGLVAQQLDIRYDIKTSGRIV